MALPSIGQVVSESWTYLRQSFVDDSQQSRYRVPLPAHGRHSRPPSRVPPLGGAVSVGGPCGPPVGGRGWPGGLSSFLSPEAGRSEGHIGAGGRPTKGNRGAVPVLLTALESGRGTELNLYGSLPLRWVHKPVTQASGPVKFFRSRRPPVRSPPARFVGPVTKGRLEATRTRTACLRGQPRRANLLHHTCDSPHYGGSTSRSPRPLAPSSFSSPEPAVRGPCQVPPLA